ncbi:MAG: 30S ribosomal protein S20 [Acidobacteria bacterium]|nr:30S ribosomal protein S20 [Acidobacteriota bacterium]
MPHQKSAKKKMRHDEKRRLINRDNKGKVRTQVKKIRKAIAEKDFEAATSMLNESLAIIDKGIKHGVLHTKTADRLKSKITKAYNKLAAELGKEVKPAKTAKKETAEEKAE